MIKAFSISNFKAFGDSKSEVRLAPITLIFGPNSSGKSSLIQSLLLLRQSFYESRLFQGNLVPSGQLIDLGSITALVNKHDFKKNIEYSLHLGSIRPSSHNFNFNFTQEQNKKGNIESKLTNLNLSRFNRENKKEFSLEFERILGKDKNKFIDNNFDFIEERKNADIFQLSKNCDPSLIAKQIRESGERFRNLGNIEVDYSQILSRQWISSANSFFPQDLIDIDDDKDIRSFPLLRSAILDFNRRFSTFISNVQYLGPVRAKPERIYRLGANLGKNVKFSGHNIISLIYDNEISNNISSNSIVKKLNEVFKTFEIPYSLELKDFTNELAGDYLLLELTDLRNKTKVLLTDVGFGISQLLPILVQGYISKHLRRNSIICVEQPEIHLHPRLQAVLADFFIDTIDSLHRSRASPLQWIIETHSEALMLRLQRRIRERKITNQDISVLYVQSNNENGASVEELRLDENGEFIDLWPDGFFVDNLSDILSGRD
jgi:predicted ATPase